MPLAAAPHLVCPFDGLPLTNLGTSLSCAKGHTFDRAREGYVNLLPVQDKASRDPGDSKEMVAARRRFLDTGAYAPIADALGDAVLAYLARGATSDQVTILDAGCGEGTYLEQLARRLAEAQRTETIHLAGIDISKWAVRVAAKRTVPATWAVASNRRPPFAANSVDLILCLFGFPIWEGFLAVQPTGGEVVLVDPGPDHLQELRALIYPEVKRGARPALTPQPGYRPVAETAVTARAHVATKQAIADLLAMTPHAHRATAEGHARLAAAVSLDVTIDVAVRTYARV
jgi:23S rRNA (guanine745-N1)-methyltransferase